MDVNAIAAHATQLSQAQLHQEVSVKVARKAMDAAEAQGQAAIDLIQAAAQVAKSYHPSKGHAIDVNG